VLCGCNITHYTLVSSAIYFMECTTHGTFRYSLITNLANSVVDLLPTDSLPNKASIFRAELHAISLALSLIRQVKRRILLFFRTPSQGWKL